MSGLDPSSIAAARDLLARAAVPGPVAVELADHACDCREVWDPRYARARLVRQEIAAGIRDVNGQTAESAIRAANRGRYNAAWRCPDCHKLVGRKRGSCPHCGIVMGSDACAEALDSR